MVLTVALATLTAWASYGLCVSLLDLESSAGVTMAGVAFVLFMVTTYLGDTGTKANTVLHIVLTFHFTVISRIFFRAEDLDKSAIMLDKLLRWDGHLFGRGLFRMQGPDQWVAAHADALGPLQPVLHGLTEWGIAIVLVAGTAYHWTSRDWIDTRLRGWFTQLPGWAMGVVFATIAVLLMHLLDGPRANIYFAF